jgi:hypothetical protein
MERDTALGNALRSVADVPMDRHVHWAELRRSINERAAPELTRRRSRHRRMLIVIPAALAAGFALFLLLSGTPEQSTVNPPPEAIAAGEVPIEDLLDADISDGQFQALLSGAAEADDLLLIAAAEHRP